MRKKKGNAEKKPGEKREKLPKDPSLRNKMYRYRLYPTKNQIGKMEWILRRSKELYNAALEERTAAYRMAGVSVNFEMQSVQLPETPLVKREKKPRKKKDIAGAGSVPQPHGEELALPGDCRSPRL